MELLGFVVVVLKVGAVQVACTLFSLPTWTTPAQLKELAEEPEVRDDIGVALPELEVLELGLGGLFVLPVDGVTDSVIGSFCCRGHCTF